MFKGKRLFNFGRRDAAPVPPAPEAPRAPPVMERPNMTTVKGSSSFNRNVIIGVVALTVIGPVVFFGVKSKNKETDDAQAETLLIREQARFEAEEKAYLKKKAELLGEFERLSRERNEIIGRLKGNYDTAKQNSEDFHSMFAEKKAEFHGGDDENESIDTAFMLKEDVEKKKIDMINQGKALGAEKEKLLSMISGNKEAINIVAHTYNQSYDGEKLPLA